MVNNDQIRQKVAARQVEGKAEREWWAKERARIKSKFMKELEADSSTGPGSASITPAPKANTSGAEKGGSDEDTVLVEGGGPAASGSTTTPKGGTSKKRKGKK